MKINGHLFIAPARGSVPIISLDGSVRKGICFLCYFTGQDVPLQTRRLWGAKSDQLLLGYDQTGIVTEPWCPTFIETRRHQTAIVTDPDAQQSYRRRHFSNSTILSWISSLCLVMRGSSPISRMASSSTKAVIAVICWENRPIRDVATCQWCNQTCSWKEQTFEVVRGDW